MSVCTLSLQQYCISTVSSASASRPVITVGCAQEISRRSLSRLHFNRMSLLHQIESHPARKTSTMEPEETSSSNGTGHKIIREGLAIILVPETESKSTRPGSSKLDSSDQSVFYNPIQQFNRDLSVLAIKAFGEESIHAKRHKWENRREYFVRKSEKSKRKRKRGDEDEQAMEEGQQQTRERQHQLEAEAVEEIVMQEVNFAEGAKATRALETGAKDDAKENEKQVPPTMPFRILDALSATGLRAIRYAKEIPFVTSITANDLSPEATRSIKNNVQHNELGDKINITTGNALAHMYAVAFGDGRKRYDVIDLDPYGTAAPFFDAAVQAANDGGLLCVTCTDPGVWASVGYPEKCFALYGGAPIKGLHSHEAGLRIILHAIATSAARYGLAIEPLLSLSIDYYARLFVRVRRSPAEVKFLGGKTMLVYNCDQGCGAWTTQLLIKNKEMQNAKGDAMFKHSLAQGPSAGEFCEHCGSKTHLGGPMYAGPLHSNTYIQRILDGLPSLDRETYPTIPRIRGMLTNALEEDLNNLPPSSPGRPAAAQVDRHPFFIMPQALAKTLHCLTPTEAALRTALTTLGYGVTRSHARPGSLKTDAPWHMIWTVMRAWIAQRAPIKEGALKEGSPGWTILNKPPSPPPTTTTTTTASQEPSNDENHINPSSSDETNLLPPSSSTNQIIIVFDNNTTTTTTTDKHHSSLPSSSSSPSSKNHLVRYQINPRPNWGPMTRAKGK